MDKNSVETHPDDQYCHIFLAWNGKLHIANISTMTMSIRITPRLARSTFCVEFGWFRDIAPPVSTLGVLCSKVDYEF